MRVLFSCNALSGHFHPLVPFARALAAAGHDIAFAAPASFAPTVTHAGFRHFPAGLDRAVHEVYPQIRTMPASELMAFMHPQVWCGLLPTHKVPDLLALAERWSPDLIVREERDYSGCIVAEALGIPHASVDVHATLGREYPELGTVPLNRQRATVGLPPDPDLAMPRRYLALRPFPPRFPDPTHAVSPTTHHVRPTPDDRSGPEGVPEWVASLPTRPVVYVGLGTLQNKPEVFRAFIAGLRDEAVTLIVTVGRNQDPADYRPQPPNSAYRAIHPAFAPAATLRRGGDERGVWHTDGGARSGATGGGRADLGGPTGECGTLRGTRPRARGGMHHVDPGERARSYAGSAEGAVVPAQCGAAAR